MAFAIGRARRLGHDTGLAPDSIVCCSFGDASMNHATALAGINAARYMKKSGAPCPILFVCEDNGIGISVETPQGWIEDVYGNAAHLSTFKADGEIDEVWDVALGAIESCRSSRSPVLLHLKCVRLWGHAGRDVEATYHELAEVEAVEARDPLLRNAKRLIETGAADPATLRAIVSDTRARVLAAAEEATRRPRLSTREQIVAPLAPWSEDRVRAEASRAVDAAHRREHWGEGLPESAKSPTKRTLCSHVASALHDEMLRRPELLVFGEDVARKGGVYGATQGLQKRFGLARVFDTLLDETSILGLAQGLAHAGFLPVPEIQYLAYLHNALDQLRGEACSLSYFSDGQFTNPMVVRIQGLAYQKGFGGHFHNDNSIGALRDIPGLMLAVPSRGDDAARMLRGALAAARACGRVVCFLEPIALYHERDLYEEGDGLWLYDYPPPPSFLLPGEVGVYGEEASDLLLVTYGNGVRLSLRAIRRLEREDKVSARVLDLRWLAPLPIEAIRSHVGSSSRVLVVDECRATGAGVADAIVAHFAEAGSSAKVRSVRAADTYVPLGSATAAVLVGEEDIVAAARGLLR
jgi:2-oxoisovalerate dehydrogenase E1 component